MSKNSCVILLTAAEAGCLEALRSGATIKSRIADKAGLDLRRANRVLGYLEEKGLALTISASPGRPARWQPTERGARAKFSITENGPRSRHMKQESPARTTGAAQRLLEHLDHPKRSTALTVELGVTRQRVNQLIVRFLATGLLRSADLKYPTRLVARADDPTYLLHYDAEKILSAFPDSAATTIKHLGKRVSLSSDVICEIVDELIAHGLVEDCDPMGNDSLFQLTAEGVAHVQRDPSKKQAVSQRLPVRSHRVRSVLDHLAEKGPVRAVNLAQELKISSQSMNALVQYLKRRGLVKKFGAAFNEPHEITIEGRRVREEMIRRAGHGIE